jgi:hypothetical protein
VIAYSTTTALPCWHDDYLAEGGFARRLTYNSLRAVVAPKPVDISDIPDVQRIPKEPPPKKVRNVARKRLNADGIPIQHAGSTLTVAGLVSRRGGGTQLLMLCVCGGLSVSTKVTDWIRNGTPKTCRRCYYDNAGRLSVETVAQARRMLAEGVQYREVARQLSMSSATLWRISNGVITGVCRG